MTTRKLNIWDNISSECWSHCRTKTTRPGIMDTALPRPLSLSNRGNCHYLPDRHGEIFFVCFRAISVSRSWWLEFSSLGEHLSFKSPIHRAGFRDFKVACAPERDEAGPPRHLQPMHRHSHCLNTLSRGHGHSNVQIVESQRWISLVIHQVLLCLIKFFYPLFILYDRCKNKILKYFFSFLFTRKFFLKFLLISIFHE